MPAAYYFTIVCTNTFYGGIIRNETFGKEKKMHKYNFNMTLLISYKEKGHNEI